MTTQRWARMRRRGERRRERTCGKKANEKGRDTGRKKIGWPQDESVLRAQRDPWSGTRCDAGAEFSSRVSVSDSSSTKGRKLQSIRGHETDRLAGEKWAEKTSEEGIQYFILTNAALFKAALIFLAWVNFVIDKTKISIKACVYELHRNRDNIPRTSIKGFKETFASFNYISLKNDK